MQVSKQPCSGMQHTAFQLLWGWPTCPAALEGEAMHCFPYTAHSLDDSQFVSFPLVCAGKFFWWWLFQLLTLATYTYYGILCVAITPSLPIAAVISTTAYAMWVLFAGFLATQPVSSVRN